MADSIDELLDEALKALRMRRKQARLMTGPVETWSIPRYLDALVYAVRSLENINDALKRQGYGDHPEHGRLQQSEIFYDKMLLLGHLTIGSVIRSLYKQEIPEDIVKAACVAAYLHPKVREAIKEGYGLIPLEPPKQA